MNNPLIKTFQLVFQRTDGDLYFSPGRVNLIGEHIDYNGGYVLPCALSEGTYGVVGKRNDMKVCVLSPSFSNDTYCFTLHDLVKDPAYAWSNYIKGSIQSLIHHGYLPSCGFDLYIEGTMPVNAGLSSSASLEMLIITMMDVLFDFHLTLKQKAQYGQYAENHFVGVNSGIMDQFAVVAGKKDHAILLDTQRLAYEYIPLNLGDYQLVIVNSNKKRGLAESKYNERFHECQTSLAILKKHMTIDHLCSLTDEELKQAKTLLPSILYKRVRHVQSEQNRTLESCDALKRGDIETFAHLMIESHQSLKKDYEVTGIELDTLVQNLLDAGAHGARMTGAGFGGCVVSIIKKDRFKDIQSKVTQAYRQKIGYEPTFYNVVPSDGTSKR